MSVIPKITSALKTFSGKPMGVMSKAIGGVTCAAVLYDAHVNGKERAGIKDTNDTADRLEREYNRYLVSEKESATICKLKKFWFNMQRSLQYPHFLSRLGGYLGGFGSTIVKDLPLIALSVVAIKFKTAGKVAGALLAGHSAKTFLYDVAGVNTGDKHTK